MLRSNSKAAKQNIMNYIRDYAVSVIEERIAFAASESEEPEQIDTRDNNAICKFIYETFMNEYGAAEGRRNINRGKAWQDIFADYASGLPFGGLFCYYYNRSAVDDVAEILQETEEEKKKYSEQDAERLLSNLIFREITARKDRKPELVKA